MSEPRATESTEVVERAVEPERTVKTERADILEENRDLGASR
jgi:hypothetical protein